MSGNLKPEFKSLIPTEITLDLSEPVKKESIMLGKMVDFEGDTFETEFTTQKEDHFITAQVNDSYEWMLDIDYDASVNSDLKNKDTFTFDFKVTQTQEDGSIYKRHYTVTIEIAGLKETAPINNSNFIQPEQVEKIGKPRP